MAAIYTWRWRNNLSFRGLTKRERLFIFPTLLVFAGSEVASMSKSKVSKPGENLALKKSGRHVALSAEPRPKSTPELPAGHLPQNGVAGTELSEKIKELVRLAQEQGHLTYNDINEALPDSVMAPETLD